MAEEGKKISFNFSKTIKKPTLKNAQSKEEKKVDYIECINENKIKVFNESEEKDEPLVIPMIGSKTWYDRISHKINADIYEIKVKDEIINGESTVKYISNDQVKSKPVEIKKESLTLEEQAVHELIQDAQSNTKQEKNESTLTVPIMEGESLVGQEESTLENYEEIPVNGFGVALLRGMGWEPGKGLGKSGKVIENIMPELRPMGLGLGADKLAIQNKTKNSEEEELKLAKGSFIKIIAGKDCDNYGEIVGFDDEASRLIIKMALGGHTVSLYESMVQLVTKNEFLKNAKVLNAKKFDKYKNEEKNKNGSSSESNEIHGKRDKSDRNRTEKEERRKKKKHRYRSDDSDTSSEREMLKKERKRRSSSSSSYDKHKRSKKSSKKHKKRDSSSERLSKKNRKKDKEREKSRAEYSNSSDRRHKKHKTSRSRSSSRRR